MKMVESYMSCTGNKKADSANTRKTTPPINVTERQKKTMNRQGWKKDSYFTTRFNLYWLWESEQKE